MMPNTVNALQCNMHTAWLEANMEVRLILEHNLVVHVTVTTNSSWSSVVSSVQNRSGTITFGTEFNLEKIFIIW